MTEPKIRTSGLYLSQKLRDAVEQLREKQRPVPSFNQMLIRLLEWALAAKERVWR